MIYIKVYNNLTFLTLIYGEWVKLKKVIFPYC